MLFALGQPVAFVGLLLGFLLALVLRALLVLRPAEVRFARLRPLLRASDPTAPGHRQARAPGATA